MTATLASLLGNRYVIFTGWTLGVVLWETTIAGVLLAGWRLLRRRARSEADYTAGLIAMFAAVGVALIVPWSLAAWPEVAKPALPAADAIRTGAAASPSILHPTAMVAVATRQASTPALPADLIAAAAALAWAIGVALLSVRLAGGWFVTRSLARRARLINETDDDNLPRLAAQAAASAGVSGSFQLLESPDVEAPVVLHWRRPAIVLPHTALLRLGPEQMLPLLTHEFAHIRRRDYPVNLLQAVVELLFFFSPAVLWISRQVREAREFCCDDVAVSHCGNPRIYVEALTTLAALGTMNATRSAQGISGPRLITRVRRLLKEEPMLRFSSLRVLALATALVVLVISGIQLSAASAARTPRRATAARQAQGRVPYGYATNQEGSGVAVKRLRTADDGSFESATVQNVSTQRITGIRFVTAVERRSSLGPMPVRVLVSDDIAVSIAPNETVDVTGAVLSAKQLDEIASDAADARLQTFFALQSVRFSNGYDWSITPNPAARSGSEVIGTPRLVYPRALIERDASRPPIASGLCVDDNGRQSSPGLLVPILNEPGHMMRCVDARWVDSAVPR